MSNAAKLATSSGGSGSTSDSQASGHIDAGRFVISVGGTNAGVEEFGVFRTPNGFEIETNSRAEGGNTRFINMRGRLRLSQDWKPIGGHFVANVGGRVSDIDLDGGANQLKLTTRIAGEQATVVRGARRVDLMVVQNQIAHLVPLCFFYGADDKKLTAFPDASITVFSSIPRKFRPRSNFAPEGPGEPVEMDQVGVRFGTNLQMELLCDHGKLIAISQARSSIAAWREGFEKIGRELPFM